MHIHKHIHTCIHTYTHTDKGNCQKRGNVNAHTRTHTYTHTHPYIHTHMQTDKGNCQKRGCNDIHGIYVPVPPGTQKSGGDANFFVLSWIEEEHAFKFTVQGGHALCADVNLTLVIRRVS
jgi:hypothetical protein